MNLRAFLLPGAALAVGLSLSLVAPSPLPAQPVTGLTAVRVATGINSPLFATAPPGDATRLFIVSQAGGIFILNLASGGLNLTPYLNLTGVTNGGGEQGLLGMAFDPDYATNGKFYVHYTVTGGSFGNGISRISQFTVSGSPDIANAASEKILLTFDHPQSNHNGGWIGFSPRSGDDHNLYIASGDGGNGNDQGTGHIEPGGNAQNNTTVLGKMLRIHVDPIAGTASIPTNNPFFGSATLRQEIWAYGLRNPFRCSFDRASGRLFIGDVGQDSREEISLQKPTNPGGGENYGWRLREGLIPTPGVGGAAPGAVDPIFDYPRSVGGTVIGGYVYRGRQIPALRGVYVFADLNGRVFTLNYDGVSASTTNFQDITSPMFPTSAGNFSLIAPVSFGEDANGELYVVDIVGSVYRIVPVTPNVEIASTTRLPSGRVLVTGFGVPFRQHTVQASPDLVAGMLDIGTVTAAADGSFSFEDPNAGSFGERYYRVVLP